ncbi:MAG TPA: response regulator transcription factor [Actinomycetospora sp.]|nr:response regulator transcription factor [Actinomycetospora sp.]
METGRTALIRVAVVDDQAVVRRGLRAVLDEAEDMEVVGDAPDGLAALELCAASRPDVVLMDVHMPRMDGIEATRRLVAQDTPARVLMVTTFDLDAYVFDSLRAGASGFVLKDAEPEELRHAVRTVQRGDGLLAPSATRRLIREFTRVAPRSAREEASSATLPRGRAEPAAPPSTAEALSDRELEIVRLVCRGLSNLEIARELYLAETTVKSHVSAALSKWGVRDRVQLVVRAFETGLVGGDPR